MTDIEPHAIKPQIRFTQRVAERLIPSNDPRLAGYVVGGVAGSKGFRL